MDLAPTMLTYADDEKMRQTRLIHQLNLNLTCMLATFSGRNGRTMRLLTAFSCIAFCRWMNIYNPALHRLVCELQKTAAIRYLGVWRSLSLNKYCGKSIGAIARSFGEEQCRMSRNPGLSKVSFLHHLLLAT